MKNIFSFKKEEKIVLFVGTIIIVGIITGGTLKAKFVKQEVYVPKEIKVIEQLATPITLKKGVFQVEVNSVLDKTAKTYVDASTENLGNVKLDFSKVDMKKVGKYSVSALLGEESKSFIIEVVASKVPVIKVVNPSFQFILEANSTMAEVKDYAKATARDSQGADISNKITGWPDSLPTKEGTITYPLTVTDAQGVIGKQTVVVQYLIQKEKPKPKQ